MILSPITVGHLSCCRDPWPFVIVLVFSTYPFPSSIGLQSLWPFGPAFPGPYSTFFSSVFLVRGASFDAASSWRPRSRPIATSLILRNRCVTSLIAWNRLCASSLLSRWNWGARETSQTIILSSRLIYKVNDNAGFVSSCPSIAKGIRQRSRKLLSKGHSPFQQKFYQT